MWAKALVTVESIGHASCCRAGVLAFARELNHFGSFRLSVWMLTAGGGSLKSMREGDPSIPLAGLNSTPRLGIQGEFLAFLPRQRVRLRSDCQTPKQLLFPSWKDIGSAPAREQVAPEQHVGARSYHRATSVNQLLHTRVWLASRMGKSGSASFQSV